MRRLVVIADDLGIGAETDRGILELATKRLVTGTVLLVNGPSAEKAVMLWRSLGQPCDLGWHPCLTIDRPVLPTRDVSTLVDRKGNFWHLNTFLARWALGMVDRDEVEQEWRAQLNQFRILTGLDPQLVNSHQHVGILTGINEPYLRILAEIQPNPWVRRVVEPVTTNRSPKGLALKRRFLSHYGKKQARYLDQAGYPGAHYLAGIANPESLQDSLFFQRCIQETPGDTVELMCHPGHHDLTLVGRDVSRPGPGLDRRPLEWTMLQDRHFLDTVRALGMEITRPSWIGRTGRIAC